MYIVVCVQNCSEGGQLFCLGRAIFVRSSGSGFGGRVEARIDSISVEVSGDFPWIRWAKLRPPSEGGVVGKVHFGTSRLILAAPFRRRDAETRPLIFSLGPSF